MSAGSLPKSKSNDDGGRSAPSRNTPQDNVKDKVNGVHLCNGIAKKSRENLTENSHDPSNGLLEIDDSGLVDRSPQDENQDSDSTVDAKTMDMDSAPDSVTTISNSAAPSPYSDLVNGDAEESQVSIELDLPPTPTKEAPTLSDLKFDGQNDRHDEEDGPRSCTSGMNPFSLVVNIARSSI